MPTTVTPADPQHPPVPWASVVMPVRKCRASVGRSLDALLRQQVPGPCELLLVCDRPDDDSIEVVRNHPLARQWRCVEIFHPGRGLAQAYNLGWRAAKSEYIFFMHSDCYPVADDSMVRMVAWLEREKAPAAMALVDIPQNDWESMNFWDRVTSSQFRHAKPTHRLSGKFDLIRRTVLERIGGFDEERFFSSAEDADMIELLQPYGRLATTDVMAVHAHQHPPQGAFRAVLRKHVQLGQGSGALFRKHWFTPGFRRRAWGVIAVDSLKLSLPIGICIPLLSPYCAVLLLLLTLYYARWAMLTRDWRVVLVPFAVAVMFSCYAVAMVGACISGRQTFDYIKAK